MQDKKTHNEGEKESRTQRFKNNFEQNKLWYVAGGVFLANTAVTLIATRQLKLSINNIVAPNIAPVFNNNIINTVADKIGRPPYLVYIKELDKFVEGQGAAAKLIGVSDATLSHYFNRGEDSIKGYQLLRYKEIV